MTSRFRAWFFVVLIAFLTFLTYLVLKPFFSPLAWATVLAVVFYPINNFLLRKIKNPWLAAFVALVVVLVIIIGPLSYLFYLLSGELQKISLEQLSPEHIASWYRGSAAQSALTRVLSLVNLDEERAFSYTMNAIKGISKQVVQHVSVELANIAGAIVNFVIMTILLFFFFKDGRTYVAVLIEFLPFSSDTTDRLSRQVEDVIVSTMYGGLAVAVAQGIVGSIGFLIVGFSSPLLWGLATAITSFIPLVGSHIVWVPLTIYLLITAQIWQAIVLALIGVIGIGLVDNIVRPLVIRGRARLSFLVTFLAVFGGLEAFGLLGIVLGPLVIALFISFMRIARDYEKEELRAKKDGAHDLPTKTGSGERRNDTPSGNT